jgi:hypothetical protein
MFYNPTDSICGQVGFSTYRYLNVQFFLQALLSKHFPFLSVRFYQEKFSNRKFMQHEETQNPILS